MAEYDNEQLLKKSSFLLDLYDKLPLGHDESGQPVYKEEPYYLAESLKHYKDRVDMLRKSIAGNYDECLRTVSHYVVTEGSVSGLDSTTAPILWQQLDIFHSGLHGSEALFRLSDELAAIRQILFNKIDRSELTSLSDRVIMEYGSGPINRARLELIRWQNSCPDEEMESDCQFRIDLAIDQLEKWRYGKEMMRYVKTNIDLHLQKANLGKFLFNFRDRLSIDHIEHIIYQHYLIQYFKAWQRESDKEAVLRQVPAEELDTTGNDSEITLPQMFTDLLSENERAVRLFIQLLGQVESKVNISPSKGEDGVIEGKSSVDGFKWPHVMQAFIDLKFIPATTPKVEFGRFIHSLFSNRTVASVTRDLYRAHESTFARIVSDIKKKFKPVYDIIHAHD